MNTYQKFVFKICLITSVIIIMLPMQSHAQEYKNQPHDFRQQYDNLRKNNLIDKSTTYKQWKKFQEENYRAKYQMEKEAQQEMKEEQYQTFSKKKKFKPRRGDILITNNASYAKLGIPGHAAIYTGKGHIVEIRGYGHHPARNSYKKFIHNKRAKRHDKLWVKVYRTSKKKRNKAANWALKQAGQKRKSITYSLNSNINDTYHTYCSKLVWQSYYFGAGKKSVNSTGVYHYFNPYNLPKNIKGAKKVKTFF